MTVRIAGPSDEQAIFDLLVFLHRHEPPLDFPLNEAKIRQKIERGTRGQGGLIGIIDIPGGGIAATASLFFAQPWWSDGFFLEEVWIYVHPNHRSPELAHWEALINWIETVKNTIGLPAVLGVFARERAEAKTRLYGSRFEMVGGLFILR